MLKMPEVSEVPGAHSIRGGINLRGRFCAMMQLREQDHRKWLLELEASVQEHRSFLMTTDPHKCAFGKWYDNYHADNAWVAALLKKVDGPHRQIHAVAADCRPTNEAVRRTARIWFGNSHARSPSFFPGPAGCSPSQWTRRRRWRSFRQETLRPRLWCRTAGMA
jgi:hypothetical protein